MIDVEASESLKEAANAAQAEVVREGSGRRRRRRAAEEAAAACHEREVEVRAAGAVGLRFDPLSTDGHH